jgi:hypothetical protein
MLGYRFIPDDILASSSNLRNKVALSYIRKIVLFTYTLLMKSFENLIALAFVLDGFLGLEPRLVFLFGLG